LGGTIAFHVPPTREDVKTSPNTATRPPTIVVTDTRLQFLLTTQRGIAWVGHNIDDHNSVQSNHLLEVDVSAIITIDIVHGQTEIGSVGVGFENVPPVRIWRLREGDVQENRTST